MKTLGWVRIAVLVVVYLTVALLASAAIRRRGSDLRDMEARSSSFPLIVGAAGNVLVLAATLAFLALVDGRPLSSLGLGFGHRDLLFSMAAAVLTPASAGLFLMVLRRLRLVQVQPRALSRHHARGLLAVAGVLLAVALQEEVLYRGYVTLNLLTYGAPTVIVASTLIFTLIHFPTNRVTRPQVVSWLLGGLVLGWSYLASGSIWVPVILHFGIDMTNVVALGVVGDLALVDLSRPISARDRAMYRLGYAALIGSALFVVYGNHLAGRFSP